MSICRSLRSFQKRWAFDMPHSCGKSMTKVCMGGAGVMPLTPRRESPVSRGSPITWVKVAVRICPNGRNWAADDRTIAIIGKTLQWGVYPPLLGSNFNEG